MLLTRKEVYAMEYHFDYDHVFSNFVRVFPSVWDKGVEVAPPTVRCYTIGGHHFDMDIEDMPEVIVEKAYRHFNIDA